jgi:hypothetical protein
VLKVLTDGERRLFWAPDGCDRWIGVGASTGKVLDEVVRVREWLYTMDESMGRPVCRGSSMSSPAWELTCGLQWSGVAAEFVTVRRLQRRVDGRLASGWLPMR